jgi:DNA-binding GntR family transcriptional regulator
VRRQLEPRAAASAARDLTETGEAKLKDAMRRIEQAYAAGKMSALLEANVDFRNAWLGMVSNSHMAQTISRFMDYFQSIRLGTFSDSDLAESYIGGLRRLHAAFLARDPLIVQDRMTLFMFAAEDAYLSVRRRQIQEPTERISTLRKRQAHWR